MKERKNEIDKLTNIVIDLYIKSMELQIEAYKKHDNNLMNIAMYYDDLAKKIDDIMAYIEK